MKPFMVFVGPNNAGKSNIFDCLKLLSDFVKEGIAVVRERGGFEQIVFNGELGRGISIDLDGAIQVEDSERKYRYFALLGGDHYGNCFNKGELLSLREESRDQDLLSFLPDGKLRTWDEGGKELASFGGMTRDRSYVSYFGDEDRHRFHTRFSREIKSWAFFNLLPPLMGGSLPVQRELGLKQFGENLSLILHVLQAEHPQIFREIEEILKTAVPEIEELTTGLTSHAPGQVYVRIREKHLGFNIPSWGMSDGTLRLLGCLATLYNPEPPPLVCFEEPENYVHPRLLELIVDLLKNASEKTQVLVTTHSPYFVDRVDPEDLFIVEKEKGKTQARPVEDPKGVKEALKTLGLGEMWYSGSLGGVP